MYEDRISLTKEEILEKNFKIDTKGYRMQEVDEYLDTIISDYNQFNIIIKSLERERKNLSEENKVLKQQLRNLKSSIEAAQTSDKEITNVDLIRRISQLEKIVLGNDEYN